MRTWETGSMNPAGSKGVRGCESRGYILRTSHLPRENAKFTLQVHGPHLVRRREHRRLGQ
ncbi:MAG TPA: hypothetical protein ENG77_00605 [Chromatiales bacterium]|nr:hypothetical protein [Chromatiales bacterium]